MKNTNKILSIVLTVAMLAGLLMMAIPVSAATNSWSIVSQPKVTAGTQANVYAIAADGKTMFLYAQGAPVGQSALYKSLDSGYTWSNTSLDTSYKFRAGNLANGAPIPLIQIVVSQYDSSKLIATDGTDTWHSTNGGQTWQVDPSGAAAPIFSVDIAEGENGGIAYLIGASDGVWLYDADGNGVWENLDNAGFGSDALAVMFSPSYPNDTAIIGYEGAGVDVLHEIEINGNAGAALWNSDVKDTTAGDFPAATHASLAVGSNFDPNSTSSNKVIVGTDVGLFRVNAKNNSPSIVNVLDNGLNVWSVAYKGTASSGTVAVGQANSADVVTSTTAMSGTYDSVSSADTLSSPTGDAAAANTLVIFSPAAAMLYAGTASTTADSGLFVSSDYTSFAGIAFIEVTSLYHMAGVPPAVVPDVSLSKLKMAGNNWFIFLTDTAAPSYRLFASTDAGATWKQIRNNGNIKMDSVNLDHGYANDQTIYIVQVGVNGALDNNSKKFLKSTDAGATWSKVSTPGNVMVTGMAVDDANTYWVGSTDGIRLNTSSTTANLKGETPYVMIDIPGFFVILTGEGSIYVSTDMGASFDRLGDKGQFLSLPTFLPFMVPAAMVGFDVPSKTIYAIEYTTQNVVKWVVGTDSAWTTEIKNADLPDALNDGLPGSGFPVIGASNYGPGGVWYFFTPGVGAGQVWRSFDDTETANAGFCPITGSDAMGKLGGGPMDTVFNQDGTATYYPLVTRAGTPPTGEYPDTIKVYADALMNAPAASSPAADAVINNTQVTALGTNTLVDLAWSAVSSAKLYEWQIANDSAFKNQVSFGVVAPPYTTPGLSVSQLSLVPGRTYYWRVRVSTPVFSRWSAGIKFTTATTSSTSQGIDEEGRIYPLQGSVITGTTITFTWGSVPTADTYDIQIFKNGTQVDSKTGLTTTTYTYSSLESGAQYTWQVRSISGGLAGNWVTSAFTTAVPPVGTPTGTVAPPAPQPTPIITVNVPPQAAPVVTVQQPTTAPQPQSTPAYVWVIIVIGAILVIAVIVLIVRTRRV